MLSRCLQRIKLYGVSKLDRQTLQVNTDTVDDLTRGKHVKTEMD